MTAIVMIIMLGVIIVITNIHIVTLISVLITMQLTICSTLPVSVFRSERLGLRSIMEIVATMFAWVSITPWFLFIFLYIQHITCYSCHCYRLLCFVHMFLHVFYHRDRGDDVRVGEHDALGVLYLTNKLLSIS